MPGYEPGDQVKQNGQRREDPAGQDGQRTMIHEIRLNGWSILWAVFWGVIAFRISNALVNWIASCF